MLVGCGGPSKDVQLTSPDDSDTTPAVETADSGTPPTELAGYVPALPTDVTADCWASILDTVDGELDGESLRLVDPATLNTTHYESDYEPDGVLDYVEDSAWDPVSGEIAYIRTDEDADGDLDGASSTSTTPPGCAPASPRTWTGTAGTAREVWTYDYEGDLRARAYLDEGDDGLTNVWFTYVRDAANRLVRLDGDRGDDGVVDEVYTYTYADLVTLDYDYTVDLDIDGVPRGDPHLPVRRRGPARRLHLRPRRRHQSRGLVHLQRDQSERRPARGQRLGLLPGPGPLHLLDRVHLRGPGPDLHPVDRVRPRLDQLPLYEEAWVWTCP